MGEWGWEPPPPPPIPTLPPPPDEREALLWALFTLLQEGGRKKVQRSRGRVKSWEGEGCERKMKVMIANVEWGGGLREETLMTGMCQGNGSIYRDEGEAKCVKYEGLDIAQDGKVMIGGCIEGICDRFM